MKVIRAVRDTRGNVIQKVPAGGVGRMKCPKCSMGNCTAQNMPNGRRVMKCNNCGASYVVSPMTSPKVAQPGAIQPRTQYTGHHHPATRPAARPLPAQRPPNRPIASPTPRGR